MALLTTGISMNYVPKKIQPLIPDEGPEQSGDYDSLIRYCHGTHLLIITYEDESHFLLVNHRLRVIITLISLQASS